MTAKKTSKKTKWQKLGYPINHGKPWIIVEMWNLVELYYQDNPRLTWGSIANILKRTVPACENRMWIIRLTFTLFKNEDAEKIMQMLEKNSGKVIQHHHNKK